MYKPKPRRNLASKPPITPNMLVSRDEATRLVRSTATEERLYRMLMEALADVDRLIAGNNRLRNQRAEYIRNRQAWKQIKASLSAPLVPTEAK